MWFKGLFMPQIIVFLSCSKHIRDAQMSGLEDTCNSHSHGSWALIVTAPSLFLVASALPELSHPGLVTALNHLNPGWTVDTMHPQNA